MLPLTDSPHAIQRDE